MLDKESLSNTLIVAISVCVICSILVAASAVGLRTRQSANARLFKNTTILKVAGFSKEEIKSAGGVDKLFEARLKPTMINLETGRADEEGFLNDFQGKFKTITEAYSNYDSARHASDKPLQYSDTFSELASAEDPAQIGAREKYAIVYRLVDESGNTQKFIFPIRGKGLWSMMKGFLALEPDLDTVAGITYYEHGETPGLGGEVENEGWKAKWGGKSVFGQSKGTVLDEVWLRVIKGSVQVPTGDPNQVKTPRTRNDPVYQVDGLSGATITSNGVTKMIEFWLGDPGFGSYIRHLRSEPSAMRPKTDSSVEH
jgi:Na+-transporting NADH:ubiquinone oxidoreductase subunit C